LVLVLMLMLMTVHVVDKRSRVVILHKKWFMSKDTYWKDGMDRCALIDGAFLLTKRRGFGIEIRIMVG
jgi:uncharacterized membrane protein